MNKKLIAVAVAAAFSAPMVASAEATIYGSIHQAVTMNDLSTAGASVQDNITVDGRDGQLGVKGSEDLGGGLKALYKFEINFSGDTGAISGTTDEVWIGLTGGWGTALIGREDHPYKTYMDSAGVDILGDSIIDVDNQLAQTAGANGWERSTASNVVAYVTPNFSGFSAAIALVAPEQAGVSAATSKDGFDAISLGANYKAGGLTVAVAYEDLDVSGAVGVAAEENMGIGASYAFGAFKVGAKYEETENRGGTPNADAERFAISGKATFGNNEVGIVYGMEEQEVAGVETLDADGWGIFGAHNFSNRTKVYAAYGDAEDDVAGGSEGDRFSVGLVHSF